MNKVALIIWLITIITITTVMIYFFIKVLKSKPKKEPDSYSENNNLPR